MAIYKAKNGSKYSEDTVMSAADKAGISLDEFVSNKGLEKIEEEEDSADINSAKINDIEINDAPEDDNETVDVAETIIEPPKKKKKPVPTSKAVSTKADSPYAKKNILDPLGLNKPLLSFNDKIPGITKPIAAAAIKKPIDTGKKNPLALMEDWYKVNNAAWYESGILDEDQAVNRLETLLNTRNDKTKNNPNAKLKDFTVSVPFMPGTDMVTLKSNKTGNTFNYSWNTGEEDAISQKKAHDELNKWVFENSVYDPSNADQVQTYKNTGLNKQQVLEAANTNGLKLWEVTKNIGGYFGDVIDEGLISGTLKNVAETSRLLNEEKDLVKLTDPNASEKEKYAVISNALGKVKNEVSNVVQKNIKENPVFKEFDLGTLLNTPDKVQAYLDDFVTKNRGFVIKTGLTDQVIKKMAQDQLVVIRDNQKLDQEKAIADTLPKDLGVNVDFYEQIAAKSLTPEQVNIYKANKNVYGLQESLYMLESSEKAKTDPTTMKQIDNLKIQIADAQKKANVLSASTDTEHNRYLYNSTTAKLAKTSEAKVDTENIQSSDITDKVTAFSKIWAGTTREKLATQFVKINSQLQQSDFDGNKKQNVVLPKANAEKFVTNNTWWINKGYTTKRLPNGDLLFVGVPTKIIAGLVNQDANTGGKSLFADELGGGNFDFYSFDTKNNKRGEKIDAKLNDWRNNNIDLKANSIAINEAYLLNQSPTKNTPGFFKAAQDGFRKALDDKYITTSEKRDTAANQLEQADFTTSEATKNDLISSFKEDVGTAAGSGIPTVAKIAVVSAITGGIADVVLGAEAIAAFNALRTSEKITEKLLYHTTMALSEEAKMQTIGLEPGSGLAFYGAGTILPKSYKFLNPEKYRSINNVTNLMGHAVNGGISMEAAGIVEHGYKTIVHDENFKEYLDKEFDGFSQVSRRILGNSLAFSYMGAPKMFSPHFFKSGSELKLALNETNQKVIDINQNLYNFKVNNESGSKGYKETVKTYKAELEKAQAAQKVISQTYSTYMYEKTLATPEGLENYVNTNNKDLFDKFKAEYGVEPVIEISDEIGKVVDGKLVGGTSFIKEQEFDAEGNPLPPTIVLNRNQIFKEGFINTGIIGHEISHLFDRVEMEVKAKKFAETKKMVDGKEKLPSKEEVNLYKDQLEANKNERIVKILTENFPDVMDKKVYPVINKETGEIEKLNVVEAVTRSYEKKNEDGKVINPAEIKDEIIKRVIEDLGSSAKLVNPLEVRGSFKNLLNDFKKLIKSPDAVSAEVTNAKQLMDLIKGYTESFGSKKGGSYANSEALAKIDLSNFTELQFKDADINDAEAIAKYDAVVNAKEAAMANYNTRESKNIEEEINKLYDLYGDNKISTEELYAKIDALENPSVEAIVEPTTKQSVSKTEKVKTVDEKKLGNEIDSFVGAKDANGKYKMTKEEWDAGGLLKAKEKLIDGKMLDPLIKKELTRNGVSADNVHGISVETFIEDVKDRLLEATLLKFNPEVNNSLGGFILGSQFGLKNKIGDVANKYKKQLSTSSIDVEAGGVGSVKELMSQEEAEFEFETEVEQGYKPKFKSLTDSKIVDKETLNTIKNKVIPVARTLKTRVDIKTSVNKSIEPIVREILNNMGSQVDIDIKTAMGGKKDNQLVNWLIKNKKAVLENATTTFLMGKSSATEVAGGIPEAVQKRVNGQWLSYPDYVGKKIDRTATTTDNKGNTSGDLMVKRTPDVANAVSDAAFINRIIDPATGNPRRGAKEAVATELAKQISLEAWRDDILAGMEKYHDILEIQDIAPEKRTSAENKRIEDLNNAIIKENPIFDAFRKNQEALGVVMADVQQSEIIRQFEQGNKKESKNIDDAIEFSSAVITEELKNAKGYKEKDDNGKVTRTVTAKEHKQELIMDWYLAHERSLRTYGYLNNEGLKTNQGLWDNMLKNLIPEELLEIKDADGKIIQEGWALKPIGKPKPGEIGQTSITYNGEYLEKFLNLNSVKRNFENNRNKIDADSKKATNDYLKLVDYYKDKPNGKENFRKLSLLLKIDQTGLIRKIPKAGLAIEGLTEKETWLEHDPPVFEQIKKTLDYFDNKISREELVKYLDNTKQNLITRNLDNRLSKNSKEGPRMENPEFLLLLNGYVEKGKVKNLESIYGSRKNFDEKVDAALKLMTSEVTSKESKDIAITNDAVTNSLTDKYSDEVKKIRVFDFDDTLGNTNNKVLYTMPDGTKGTLSGSEFAEKAGLLANNGAQFDFSDFANVREGVPGPLLSVAKAISQKRGTSDIFVLTARPADAAEPIQEFLRTFGLDIPLENITGLGDSRAQAKADWITAKASEGYNDFYFVDDHLPNVKAVKDALDVLDVKGRVQQAKKKFSLDISENFNKIIEENTGMESYKVFSDIVARRRGVNKNKFDIYVPPSAADFELLLYNFIGKGQAGEGHKKFFSEALLKPYSNGTDLMDAARQSIKKDYKALTDQFPDIRSKIEKLTPDGDYTYDQALRVAMWSEAGIEIPGISQRDQVKLTDLVNNDAELTAFKQGLIATGRQGNGWIKPSEYWDASTIISDLHNLTEGEGRKKFLGEFVENYEKMFGKFENGKLTGPNMNKIEAVYGTNVREALEDSLYRMTNGKNRSYGKDKETSRWSNWVNGSTGTIMFLNTRSAALQLIGAVNFLNLRDNNPIAAGKAFANQKQYWEDFSRIWNSDKMKERRGGLKEDVAAAEIANAAANSKNKVNATISYLLKIGYTPTQLADSFAIASGGAPFYRNRIKTYLKEGQTEAEAEANAWSDFTKVSDETQQSADPRDISKQQASPAGRLLLTFQNTAMQQARTVKKSFLDLKNGRGDAKTHVAKIIYYLGVQNLLFAGLQQGLFAVAFDDDDKELDPEKEKAKEKTVDKKIMGVADGVLDTILRGTGFLGGIVSVLKNMVNKYLDEKDKDFKADYAKVMLEGANISPPIGSKLRKIYTGLQQTKFEKDLIEERGWGVMQDGRVHLGSMYGVTGKLVEASTNFPMDRIVNKVENVSQAMNSQNKAWQRVAVALGFTPYSVGIEDTKGDLEIRAKAKATRKEAGKTKRKDSSQQERDSIANLSEDAYMDFVRSRKEARERKKDSIANLPADQKKAYLEKKAIESEARKREKEALKKIKSDSIAGLSPSQKANYNKKVAAEKLQKKKERHDKYEEKKKALQDSLARLTPKQREKYKADKKAERHQYYIKNKKPSKKKNRIVSSDTFI